MPECYTYIYNAMHALMRSGHMVASQAAFMAGASGPDPFFFFHAPYIKNLPDIPALGIRMHHENTGLFLSKLAELASTPTQQSYAMGYVTHYTADCTLSPYFSAMSKPDMPYAGTHGEVRLAMATDSELYYRDYKTRFVPASAAAPVLITEDLAQVATLLHNAILSVYDIDVPLLALADIYHQHLALRKKLAGKSPLRSLWAHIKGGSLPDEQGGPFPCRMQPAKPLLPLPSKWQNPYTAEEVDLTFDEVIALAEHTSAVCVTALMRYWLGELSAEMLAEMLGNNDYYTGLPVQAETEAPTAEQNEATHEAEPA